MSIPFVLIALLTSPGWMCIPIGIIILSRQRPVDPTPTADEQHANGAVLDYDSIPPPDANLGVLAWVFAFYPLVLTAIMITTTLTLWRRTGLWPGHLPRDLPLTPTEDGLAVLTLLGTPPCAALQLIMLGFVIRELTRTHPDRQTAWAAIVFGVGTLLSAGVGFEISAWLWGD